MYKEIRSFCFYHVSLFREKKDGNEEKLLALYKVGVLKEKWRCPESDTVSLF